MQCHASHSVPAGLPAPDEVFKRLGNNAHMYITPSFAEPQVTEAQLQVTSVPGSRYSFKPSGPAVGTSAGSGGSLPPASSAPVTARYSALTPHMPTSNAYRNITNAPAMAMTGAGKGSENSPLGASSGARPYTSMNMVS